MGSEPVTVKKKARKGRSGNDDGWEKMFTIDEPRLGESVELYESLGYEVKLRTATKEEMGGDCCVCINSDKYKTIYVRKKKK